MANSETGSKQKFIRVWRQLDTEDVKSKLLYLDDLYGTCGNCKHLGLNYLKDKSCPSCKTVFQYATLNSKKVGDAAKILARIAKEGLNLTLIEREDFELSNAKEAAENLFKI